MLPEVVLVAFDFDIQLLNSNLFLGLNLLFGLFPLFRLLGKFCGWFNLHLRDFLDMFALFNLVIHFFQFLLVFFFLVILIIFLVVLHLAFGWIFLALVFFTFAKFKILQLSQDSNIFQLIQVTDNFRMPEFWSIVSLEISKLLEESGYLSDYSEKIIWIRMVMHFKSFDCFIVFNNRVKWFFFKLLPVSTQIILCVWVEKQEEILDVWNDLFELEIVPSRVKLESFFLQLSNTVWSLF